MAFSFWKKMFGGSETDIEVPAETARPEADVNEKSAERHGGRRRFHGDDADFERAPLSAQEIADGIKKLEGFVEYLAKELVDNPDAVTVATVEKERLNVIQVRCEKRDIGKLIGKNGKTIAAIRLLISGAGGRMGLRITVDVLD